MLHDKQIVAFIASTDPNKTRHFYTDVLGLLLIAEDDFALVYEAGGTPLRIQKVKTFTPHPFTALGWEVPDMEASVRALRHKQVTFETFGLPGQDENGIWTAPGGTKVVWFKDPDGNLLSISTAL
jgi:catechol 2,3-dioxygenase-like lactoylglutathione lyase family enzyme